MFELLGVIFTGVCIATERPDEPLSYRKPSPRFINELIALHRLDPKQCWMAGAALSDVDAGLNAGIHAVLLQGLS
jgi:D-glycero-D-manno-heptose 1,7-bisphosphate phosphatase